MLPIAELRGGLPFALAKGISPLKAYFLSVAGNLIPVIPLFLLLKFFSDFIKRCSKGKVLLDWVETRVGRKKELVRRYGLSGVILLVAVPLPVTGAWTGTLVSFLLLIRLRYAFPAICLGVCLAGLIVLLVSLGIMEGIRIFVGM